jgi:hypothetical protein
MKFVKLVSKLGANAQLSEDGQLVCRLRNKGEFCHAMALLVPPFDRRRSRLYFEVEITQAIKMWAGCVRLFFVTGAEVTEDDL